MLSSLILKSGRDRSILNRHPWVFSGAVKQEPSARNGEIVQVCDNHGKVLGYGFYSPKSQIRCRMFHFEETGKKKSGGAFSSGAFFSGASSAASSPGTRASGIASNTAPLSKDYFGKAYWAGKLNAALQLRRSLLAGSETTCYRLLHAEGDFLPGIIADVYGPVVVVQILNKGMEEVFPHIEAALSAAGFNHIYLKQKENTGFLEEVSLTRGWRTPAVNMPIEVKENGLRFNVDVEAGQKTGFFLDQRDNRELTREVSHGRKVLNAFSYTGAFSVYALAGGAEEVHSVDVSKEAIALAEQNVALNDPKARHTGVVSDCFDYLKTTQEDYDLIILDPPAFAKNARAVPNATRGYKELNLSALRKIRPGGLLFTYSCSQNITSDLFRKVVFGAAVDSGREVRIIRQLSQSDDHPIDICHPEGEYLKGLMLHVS